MRCTVAVVVALSAATAAWAGPTAHVGRELTKGVGEEVKQQAQSLDVRKGARDVGGGLVEGIAGQGKTLERGAHAAGRELVQGMLGELRAQSVCREDDRAACLDALVERFAYASSRAAARGAADGAPAWSSLLVGAAGFVFGLVASALIALLLGQRRTRRELTALRSRPA